ncbi:hypothetical protein CLAFUW4_08594 [Fulvia fulva]|uniref:Uncharacterized protein n=1 Tax=Passalora fulva TaxID=5499 RepID=A0A9Q8P6D7_PASFU|nr:uncharacterized protein CLAFUR5_08696 [Fulvia fulva]KAK4628984.1 hypothetical protein CLAFUR4_08597 [Fulvia fulva]KAK4630666.1 hypothetical protein CLAFUR0_08592 [Fulvia fulva]UJO14894.1 hypothetical protein CLAFUR5_08696 [Fulvia fulva]WPV12994.1 hypothetical protein CLAFUW4_08594 [Fulvia fulva]WPV27057.1 hypothetical protein CLAFUW7_08592 [Fulvia fulva]
MQSKTLSKADSKVLEQVFDPESGPAKAEVLVNPDLPIDRHISDHDLLAQLKSREKEAISFIEQCEASGRAHQNKDAAYLAALAILDDLINSHPDYASARNNRAQLRRWRFGDRNTLCQRKACFNNSRRAGATAAVADLKSAITLASPDRPQDAVSPTQGRLLAQAHTQLGAIYYAAFKDLEEDPDMEVAELESAVWTKDKFEEEASRLFYLGGLYGNEVAKALAVHTNPHAKLCGSIVKEAMRKELSGAA